MFFQRTGYKEFVLRSEVDEAYDSDVDPAYMPNMILDSDYDFDEFSDGEIDEEEVKLLTKECEGKAYFSHLIYSMLNRQTSISAGD